MYVQTGKAHEEFKSALTDMKVTALEIDLFKVAFENVKKKRNGSLLDIRKVKEKDLKKLVIEKENIEDSLIRISKPGLIKKLEKKREQVE